MFKAAALARPLSRRRPLSHRRQRLCAQPLGRRCRRPSRQFCHPPAVHRPPPGVPCRRAPALQTCEEVPPRARARAHAPLRVAVEIPPARCRWKTRSFLHRRRVPRAASRRQMAGRLKSGAHALHGRASLAVLAAADRHTHSRPQAGAGVSRGRSAAAPDSWGAVVCVLAAFPPRRSGVFQRFSFFLGDSADRQDWSPQSKTPWIY